MFVYLPNISLKLEKYLSIYLKHGLFHFISLLNILCFQLKANLSLSYIVKQEWYAWTELKTYHNLKHVISNFGTYYNFVNQAMDKDFEWYNNVCIDSTVVCLSNSSKITNFVSVIIMVNIDFKQYSMLNILKVETNVCTNFQSSIYSIFCFG